jgi:cupin 2 domain-containing protein
MFRPEFGGLMEKRNLLECLPTAPGGEHFDVLLETAGFTLERIVSWHHATPAGEWYDQGRSEWVVLLKGSAGLSVEGEAEIQVLLPGDYLYLPAHVRHRVAWTQAEGETVWLALHHQD